MTQVRSKPRLALFDIDGTLVSGPSAEKRFTLWLLLGGKIGLIRLLAYALFSLRYLPRYGLGVFEKNKSLLWRREVHEARALALRWAGNKLAKALFPPCVERLRQHEERGDIVVLLSGTPDFLADAVARQLGVAHAVGTRCAIRSGRFGFAPPAIHRVGEAKLSAARELCRQFGATLSDSAAYANSISDLPLLAACGMPIAVNPDPILSREAARQGWEIIGARPGSRIRASA